MDGTRRCLVSRDVKATSLVCSWSVVFGPRTKDQGPLDGPSTKNQGPGTRSVEVQESQALNLQVVGVEAGQVGADAHQHRHGSGADETARDELLPDERAGGIDVLADFRAQRDNAPVDGEPPRGVVAI